MSEKIDIPMERAVNEILYHDIFGNIFEHENETFMLRPYDWSDELNNNEFHFWHKPSGLKIQWYKHPLRSPYSNMKITHEQFLDVLRDCHNSMQEGKPVRLIYKISEWWK